jgi:hypothetical protein
MDTEDPTANEGDPLDEEVVRSITDCEVPDLAPGDPVPDGTIVEVSCDPPEYATRSGSRATDHPVNDVVDPVKSFDPVAPAAPNCREARQFQCLPDAVLSVIPDGAPGVEAEKEANRQTSMALSTVVVTEGAELLPVVP